MATFNQEHSQPASALTQPLPFFHDSQSLHLHGPPQSSVDASSVPSH